MAKVSPIQSFLNTFRFLKGRASGMHADSPISQQPENTYRNAWGVSNQSSEEKGGGVYNMPGMGICATLPKGADIRGQHFLEERNQMVVFLNINGKSEIGQWSTENCEYKKIIDDNDITGCKLEFGSKEWIPIVSKNMRNGTCQEIHLYWSNNRTYKTLNIDRPCVPIDCDEINLFNCKCVSTPKATTTKKGGFDLEAGAYQYFAQLEDEDKNTTNFFSISNPLYVGSKNNRAGDISEQAVNVVIEHLDPDYPYVNLAVIKTVGGVKKAYVIAKLSYSPNGATFFHRSKSQHLYDLEIEEILVKNPGYIRGDDLFQHDRVLYLFNTMGERELDMQARILESVKGKYKVGRVQMRYAHMFSGLQRNAVYSFGLNYNFCDGRKSRSFHFAANGLTPEGGKICTECEDQNLKHGAPVTQMEGKPYDNPITKGNDEYTPFTPTAQGLLNSDDFSLPDDDQFVPPDTSGEGNACACWAFQQAAIAGIGNRQAFAALYHVLKDICESGCVEGVGNANGQIIIPRSTVEDEEGDDFVIDTSTMPTADDAETNPDKRFKKLDDIDMENGDKPSDDEINGSVGQGDDGNNANTTKGVHTGSSDSAATSGKKVVTIKNCEPKIIYADSDCCVIKEIIPCIDSEGEFIVYQSCEKYPDEERCCAEGKTYGSYAGKPIQYWKTPSIANEPHFISYHDGVPSAEHRDNHEYNNSFARFIWPEFSGIPFPKDDELDVPLCPINPFDITWELRDPVNDTVLASGVIFGTFEGETLGEPMLFGNHGTNSPERVDRWINNNGSHRSGIETTIPAYLFHSPDTSFDRPVLQADYMHDELALTGRGWRHHLYAEGVDPDSSFVGKKNRKGARSSMNLNKWDPISGDNIKCIKAIAPVDGNTILDKADEFSRSLNNLNRPSTTYIETEGDRIPMVDTSFDRNVETMQASLTGAAHYVSLTRFIPNAYGAVTDNVYYPLWPGSSEDIGEDGKATVLVRTGDTFINYWSIKRTSYVSNHVAPHPRGIKPNFEFGGGIKLPWPLQGILRSVFNAISADCNCGSVPEGGNGLRDPRASNALNGSGTPDRYFPQVQTQLISFPVESRVNLGFQGSGDDPSTSTYRDLNGLTFDSTFDGGDGAYERSWMDRFFGTMCENPKWKCLLRTLANFLFTFVIGAFMIFKGATIFTDALTGTQVGFVITIMTVVSIGLGLLLMLAGFIWIIAWANTDLDNRMIDNLLKISDCFPDKRPKRGGDGDAEMKDSRVQGWEDNHYEYNYDFSLTNRIQPILGLPAGFDPCHCPNSTTYPIWHSNPQNPESRRDAYRNFKTNGYFLIPTNYGPPKRMHNLGSSVYLQTTDARFKIISDNIDIGSDVYLQTAGRFLRHAQLVLGSVPEGMGGTNDPNACEVTKWGDITVDVESRKIYLFNGSSYEQLGDFGMTKFLDNFMAYEATGDVIRDERAINGVGYSLGVDNERDILFITKTDKKGKKDRSWTLSFDMENKAWIGNEFFTPKVYAWDRYHLFSYNNDKMWQHNKVGEFSTVYGVRVPMVLDFVIRDEKEALPFKWHSTSVTADFDGWDDLGLVPRNKLFFSHIGAYNTFQSSGLMPVKFQKERKPGESNTQDPKILPVSQLHRSWQFSKLVDKVHTTGKRLMTSQRNNFFTEFNKSVIGGAMTNEHFIDDYMVMRLVFDVDDTKVRVLLRHARTKSNPEQL